MGGLSGWQANRCDDLSWAKGLVRKLTDDNASPFCPQRAHGPWF